MAEGAMKCVKLALVVFNFIFFMVGLALIIVGGVVLAQFSDYEKVAGSRSAPIFIMILGAIILVIAFFGCCGAYKENHCMVMTFAVIVGIIFFLEIVAAIVAFVFRNKVEDGVLDALNDNKDKYTTDGGAKKLWDSVQHELKCCGVHNYTDWDGVEGLNNTYPDSCCKDDSDGCGKTVADPAIFWPEGCVDKFVDYVKDRILIVGGVALGLAFIELMGILCACCLASSIKKNYEVV